MSSGSEPVSLPVFTGCARGSGASRLCGCRQGHVRRDYKVKSTRKRKLSNATLNGLAGTPTPFQIALSAVGNSDHVVSVSGWKDVMEASNDLTLRCGIASRGRTKAAPQDRYAPVMEAGCALGKSDQQKIKPLLPAEHVAAGVDVPKSHAAPADAACRKHARKLHTNSGQHPLLYPTVCMLRALSKAARGYNTHPSEWDTTLNAWAIQALKASTFSNFAYLQPFYSNTRKHQRPSWLARAWNHIMHSINGNPPKGANKSHKKKKTPTQKKAGRAKRTAQLHRQAEVLRKAQTDGLGADEAKGLGRIIRGRGDYSLGENIGSKIGGFLGKHAHAFISRLLGHGDYEVIAPSTGIKSNSLLACDTTPQFSRQGGAVLIASSDYIGYFATTTDFSVNSIMLDFSDRHTFPWGWQVGAGFQQWALRGAIVVLKSNMSQLTTSPTVGTVFGSVRYDVDSEAPKTKTEVMNSLFAASGRASSDLVFPIECAPNQTIVWPLKIRQPGNASGDEQFYRLGILDICSEGVPVPAAKGIEVTIVYEVELYKPRLSAAIGSNCLFMDLAMTYNTMLLTPLANTTRISQPRINTLGLKTSPDGIISFPYDTKPGTAYMIQIVFRVGTGYVPGTFVTFGNYNFCSASVFAFNQSSVSWSSAGALTTDASFCVNTNIVVKIGTGASVGSPPALKVSYAGSVVAGFGNLYITEVDPRVCDGITAESTTTLTREQFLDHLISLDEGLESKCTLLDFSKLRLVDYVDAFRRNPVIDVDMVGTCAEAYDVGIAEAIDRLAVFRPRKRLPHDTRTRHNSWDEHVVVHSSINGNNGTWTNTDDVKSFGEEISTSEVIDTARSVIPQFEQALLKLRYYDDSKAERVVELNPPGLTGAVSLIRAHVITREEKGWANPCQSVIVTSPEIFLLYAPPAGLLQRLKRHEPKGRYTVNKLRRIQCRAILGYPCTHDLSGCPGYASLLKDILLSHPCLDSEDDCDEASDNTPDHCTTLNGNNGSCTNTDDVEPVYGVCAARGCRSATHYHKKSKLQEAKEVGPDGRQRREGAARRIATARSLELCVDTNGQPNPLVAGNCFKGAHYHKTVRVDDNEETPNTLAAARAGPALIVQRIVEEKKEIQDDVAVMQEEKENDEDMLAFRAIQGYRFGEVPGANEYSLFDRPFQIAQPPTRRIPIGPPPNVTFQNAPVVQVIQPPARDGANARPRGPILLPPPEPPIRPPPQVAPVALHRVHQDNRRQAQPPNAPQPPIAPAPAPPPPRLDVVPAAPPLIMPLNDLQANRGPVVQELIRARRLLRAPVVQQPPPAAQPNVVLDPANDGFDPFLNLRDRARNMWLIRDPNSASDERAIYSALVAIARNEHLWRVYPDMSERIIAISGNACREITNARIEAARMRAIALDAGCNRYLRWVRQGWRRIVFASRVEELKYVESQQPYSRTDLTIKEMVGTGIVVLGVTLVAVALYYKIKWTLNGAAASLATSLVTMGRAVQPVADHVVQKLTPHTTHFFSFAHAFFLSNCPTRTPWAMAQGSQFLPAFDKAAVQIIATHHSATPARQLANRVHMAQFIKSNYMKWFLYGGFIGPASEELLKRAPACLVSTRKNKIVVSCIAGLAYGLLENCVNGPVFGSSLTRPLAHAMCAMLPLSVGYGIHSAFNVLSYTDFIITAFGAVLLTHPISILALPVLASALRRQTFELACMEVDDVCLDGILQPARTQRAFVYRPADATCVPKLGCLGFWGIAGYKGSVFRMCTHNEEIALCGRVGKLLPAHENVNVTRAVTAAWANIIPATLQLMLDLGVPRQHEPMNFELWASSFPPLRREALLRIGKHPESFPLHASAFIKREVASKNEANPVFKDPRWIQGCPLELSCSVGPYLRPWVKSVRDCFMPDYTAASIRLGRQIVYTCGLNAVEVGNHFRDAIDSIAGMMPLGDDLIIVEDDQSRFDLHLLEGPFMFLNSVYGEYLPRRVQRLLRRRTSKGTSSIGSRYSVPYTMQSGWPDTSIGDTLVNIAMKFAVHGRGRAWISIVCGDDSVTITCSSELQRIGGIVPIRQLYAQFGMEIEVIVRSQVLEAEFCSGRFYPCRGSYVLMPRIGRLLAKICWDMEERPLPQRFMWLRSISTTLISYGQVDPLLNALGQMLNDYVGQGPIIQTESEYKYYVGETIADKPSQDDVALYYSTHYDIPSGDVQRLVNVIRRSSLGKYCRDSQLEAMAEKDCA